jgi:hypothetical protein
MPQIQAVREGNRWAIKHGAGYLGHVATETEAHVLIGALKGFVAAETVPSPNRARLNQVPGTTKGAAATLLAE